MTNPPSEKRDSHIQFKFTSMIYFHIINTSNDSQSVFKLKIHDPRSVSFKNTDENNAYSEFKNLLLAINFHLSRSCVISSRSSFTNHKINLKPIPTDPFAHVTKNNNTTQANMRDNVTITDSLHVGVTGLETFNEREVIKIFEKIQSFDMDKNNNTSKNQRMEIEKALDMFTQSMESLNLQSKFRNLFNSLELIVNSDGVDRTGPSFDKEVISLTHIPIQEVTKWRNFYSRTKHISRNNKDIQNYMDGINELTKMLPILRECCTKIILSKL